MSKAKKSSDHRKLMDRLVPDPLHGRLLGILATTYEMQPEFFGLFSPHSPDKSPHVGT